MLETALKKCPEDHIWGKSQGRLKKFSDPSCFVGSIVIIDIIFAI
jgi:hypothetical protein